MLHLSRRRREPLPSTLVDARGRRELTLHLIPLASVAADLTARHDWTDDLTPWTFRLLDHFDSLSPSTSWASHYSGQVDIPSRSSEFDVSASVSHIIVADEAYLTPLGVACEVVSRTHSSLAIAILFLSPFHNMASPS